MTRLAFEECTSEHSLFLNWRSTICDSQTEFSFLFLCGTYVKLSENEARSSQGAITCSAETPFSGDIPVLEPPNVHLGNCGGSRNHQEAEVGHQEPLNTSLAFIYGATFFIFSQWKPFLDSFSFAGLQTSGFRCVGWMTGRHRRRTGICRAFIFSVDTGVWSAPK